MGPFALDVARLKSSFHDGVNPDSGPWKKFEAKQ